MKQLSKEAVFSVFSYAPSPPQEIERFSTGFLKNMKALIYRSKEFLFKEINKQDNSAEVNPIFDLISNSNISEFRMFLNYLDPVYVELLKKVGNLIINHYIYLEEYERCKLLKDSLKL